MNEGRSSETVQHFAEAARQLGVGFQRLLSEMFRAGRVQSPQVRVGRRDSTSPSDDLSELSTHYKEGQER